MGRVIGYAAAGFVAFVVIIAGAVAGIASLLFGSEDSAGFVGGRACWATITTPDASPQGLTGEQVGNARTIVTVGQRMGVPPRGWVIAIATALQESNLINSGKATDHDSLGLFQQRPSQGWGTPEQVTNPDYASTKFYERLIRVPGWDTMALTDAAQAVQRSAYPGAYAKHEPRATAIVTAYTGGTLPACDGTTIAASGWTRPVVGTVGSGFRTGDRPGHDGVDIMAARNTVIRAASSGVVVRVVCNVAGTSSPPTGGPMPCDTDGHSGLGGCGWYAEVRHAGNIVSRYCHMVRQPSVTVGQSVSAGQPIGHVGTSGNSSGPHLHFEIHTGAPATENNAVNPVPFMSDKGVSL